MLDKLLLLGLVLIVGAIFTTAMLLNWVRTSEQDPEDVE